MSVEKPWRTIKSGISIDGHAIELRHNAYGKGRFRIETWRIYRDGEYSGYGATLGDAEENFDAVMEGYIFNSNTGTYEKQTGQPNISRAPWIYQPQEESQ